MWPEVYRDWARGMGLLRPAPAADAAPVLTSVAHRPAAVTDAAASGPTARAAASSSLAAPSASGARNHADTAALTIVRPLGGAVFLIDPTLRPEFQALTLTARASGAARLEWFVDGDSLGIVDRDASIKWSLARGHHEIVVRDDQGRSAATRIDVR